MTWCSPSGSYVTSAPCGTRSHRHGAVSCVAHYVTRRWVLLRLAGLLQERHDPGALGLALLGHRDVGHDGDLSRHEMLTVDDAHEARKARGVGGGPGRRHH